MANSNKNKGEKDPILAEIENDETPIETPVETPTLTLDTIINKNPDEVTAEEMDFLSENKEDLTDEQKVQFGLIDAEEVEPDEEEDETPAPVTPPVTPVVEETPEDKEKKYRAQQTEAQIQQERNNNLISTINKTTEIPEPTEQELRTYVAQEGVDWEDLTPFEQSMAKKNLLNEKRLSMIQDVAQEAQKVDEWATKVDQFIQSTDSKPEYLALSGNETAFRSFAMQKSHRGTPLEVLLPAFLHNLPPKEPKRGSLFNRGGGGEAPAKPSDVITDAQQAANLRLNNPNEYKKLVKAGKIKVEV